MALTIRNQFVQRCSKGVFVICSFFSLVLAEPFQDYIYHDEMVGNLIFQLTIIPLLMGPLMSMGVMKKMKEGGVEPVKFTGFLGSISFFMPQGMIGKAIYWTFISYVLFGFPAIFSLIHWGIEAMTGPIYMAFKVVTTAIYVTCLSYLITSASVSESANNPINMRI